MQPFEESSLLNSKAMFFKFVYKKIIKIKFKFVYSCINFKNASHNQYVYPIPIYKIEKE